MKTVDVICPVFREEETVVLFHERLSGVLDGLSDKYTFRIRYVLDPWPDTTEAKLAMIVQSDSRAELIVMSRRFGHQAALIAGMNESDADAVIMLDSDLQHPPELIPEILMRWESGAQIVQAIRQDTTETGFFKRVTSRWFYALFLKLGGAELEAGAADYRLLSREVVDIFRDQIREHNPFLRGLVGWVGFRTDRVLFTPKQRVGGQSKYSVSTLLNFALNGMFSFSKLPLRICIIVGAIVATLSIVAGILQILIYLTGTANVPGWASLFASVSFIGGIQLFFLGVVGDYIGLIFDEVKGRPRYIVARRMGRPGSVATSGTTRISKTETSPGAYNRA